jgi:hypothetical protein
MNTRVNFRMSLIFLFHFAFMTFLFSFPSDQIEVLYSYHHITRVLVNGGVGGWWWVVSE